MATSSGRWNHNTHYHSVILDAIPPGCQRALDVGCGEGALTRELRRLIPEVVGIDNHHAGIAAAQAHPNAGDVQYVEGDALAFEFEPTSFDLITAVASLHHMHAERALVHLRSLLRPGGVLAMTGLARSSPSDWPFDVAAVVPNRVRRIRAHYWQHPSPVVWPPPESYAAMRRITARSTRRPLPTPALLALHSRLGQALTARLDPLRSRDAHLAIHAGGPAGLSELARSASRLRCGQPLVGVRSADTPGPTSVSGTCRDAGSRPRSGSFWSSVAAL